MKRHVWVTDRIGGSEHCVNCGAWRGTYNLKPYGRIWLDDKPQPYCPGKAGYPPKEKA